MVKCTHRVKIGPGLEEIVECGMKPSTPEPKMNKSILQLIKEGYDGLLPADYHQYIEQLQIQLATTEAKLKNEITRGFKLATEAQTFHEETAKAKNQINILQKQLAAAKQRIKSLE